STWSRVLLAQPAERVIAPAGRSEPLDLDALAYWDALPEWGFQEPRMGLANYRHTGVSPTSPSSWNRSTPDGTAAVSLARAAAASHFPAGSAPGGNHISGPAWLGSPVLLQSAGSAPAQASASPRMQDFGRTPLSFEANQGQSDSQVQYQA